MITAIIEPSSNVDAALFFNLIDWLVTDVPIGNTSATGFTAVGPFDGQIYTATVTGTDLGYVTVNGGQAATSGIVDTIEFVRDGVTTVTITNVNIDMATFSPIIVSDISGVDRTAIELFLMSQDWDITFGDTNDQAGAGVLVGDNVPFNLVGNDVLNGGAGNDVLFAGSGSDVISGGDGNDVIIGGRGSDEVFGGAGDDVFIANFDDGNGFDEFDGGDGIDILALDPGEDRFFNFSLRSSFTPEAPNVEIISLRNSTDSEVNINLVMNAFNATMNEIRIDGDNIDAGITVFMSRQSFVDLSGILVTGFFEDGISVRGDSSDETIIGFSNREAFYDGESGNDNITAGAMSDILLGKAGDDTLLGDGAPSLSLDSSEGELFRAYEAVFDRAPDAGGFNAFLTEIRLGNLTQEDVITQFVDSTEFQNTYGSLGNEAFVRQLFLNVLDREGDAGGIEAFTGALAGGRSRASVVVEFANSAEFVQLMTLPSAAFATNVIINPAEAQVFRIYQAVFLRDPDEAGFTAFTNSIQAGVLTVEEITAEFVGSEEFQLTYGDLDNADFVELLFANVLPGNTDTQGRADFTQALNSGTLTRETMVAEFVETFEFVQRMSGPAVEFVSDVFSGAGDTLDGGTGDDLLFGGRGADEFVYDTEEGDADIILDFTSGTDSLDVGDNADFDTFAEIMAAGSQAGLDTVFDFGDGNTLTLENVVLSELTEGDFGFGDSVGNSKPNDAATAVNTLFLQTEEEVVSDIADFELYEMFG